MSDYKELKAKKFGYLEAIQTELEYYFPECTYEYISEPEKGCHKYTWNNYIVLEYYNEFYKIDLESSGNGGWLDIDDYQITAVNKCKRIETTSFTFINK